MTDTAEQIRARLALADRLAAWHRAEADRLEADPDTVRSGGQKVAEHRRAVREYERDAAGFRAELDAAREAEALAALRSAPAGGVWVSTDSAE